MSKTLIAYFSLSGKTKAVAEKIAALTGGDLYEVKTAQPYTGDVIATAKKELADNARPALAAPLPDISGYDTVIIGFPNWCKTMPMAMFTFLEGLDLKGKRLLPFITHGGGGVGNSDRDIARVCAGATVSLCLDGNDIDEDVIKKWLDL